MERNARSSAPSKFDSRDSKQLGPSVMEMDWYDLVVDLMKPYLQMEWGRWVK